MDTTAYIRKILRRSSMKLYNSKQISAILKKAAENSSTNAVETPMGLSLDELRQVASEAGIDPKEIDRAAAELESDHKKEEPTLWGGPFSYQNQVMANGEITGKQWEEMLISIRKFFQSKGDVSIRPSVYEWSSPWGTTNNASVTAFKDSGKTKISLNWNGPLTSLPFYLPVPLVAIASVLFASEFLLLPAVPGFVFVLLATGLTFFSGRWALRRHLVKGYKKLQTLINELDLIAGKEVSPADKDVMERTTRVSTPTDHSLSNILIEDDQDNESVNPKRHKRTQS